MGFRAVCFFIFHHTCITFITSDPYNENYNEENPTVSQPSRVNFFVRVGLLACFLCAILLVVSQQFASASSVPVDVPAGEAMG